MNRIPLVVLVLAAAVGLPSVAKAEPKNELPFTRSVDPRSLSLALRPTVASPRISGESKNALPFTRAVAEYAAGVRHTPRVSAVSASHRTHG
jgi:hypothetical protein